MALRLSDAKPDSDGAAVLWPKPLRGKQLVVTSEAVETMLAGSIRVLGLRSAAGTARAIGFTPSAVRPWFEEPPRPPSSAAVLRLLYLFCLHAKAPERWHGDGLMGIDWNHVHLYGIPFTPLGSSAGTMQVRGNRVIRASDPLFASRSPFRKDATALQFETVIALTVKHLGLRDLQGLAQALGFSYGACRRWVGDSPRRPSQIALYKMIFLWLLHLSNPRKWSGLALLRIDWTKLIEYGIEYERYQRPEWAEEAAEVRKNQRQRRETSGGRLSDGTPLSPIVRH